jgi:hypothetical protein
VNDHSGQSEKVLKFLNQFDSVIFVGHRVGAVVHVARVTDDVLGQREQMAVKVTVHLNDFLRRIRRRDVSKENTGPFIIFSIQNETMITTVGRIQNALQEHFGYIGCDNPLKLSQSHPDFQQILETIWGQFNF